jgi:hypothetical protein
MSRIPRDMSEVHAPKVAVAWAASRGWIYDDLDLDAVRGRADDVVVLVDDDRWVRNLAGPAPLAAVVRVDRDLQELVDRYDRMISGLMDVATEGPER